MNFSNKIYKLRVKEKMSQEEFADLFSVSRQAVQKWESGASLPEISKLAEIAKHFGVSLDYLILERSERRKKELIPFNETLVSFENIHYWEFYASSILDEYKQSYDEGLDVEKYKPLFEAISRLPQDAVKKELGDIAQKIVLNVPYRKDYKHNEPSALSEIKSLRKSFPFVTGKASNLQNKIHGAWMGRICGCMLGKTVECIRTEELQRFLKETDNFPMKRYILKSDLEKVDLSKYNFDFTRQKFADDVNCMPIDDDTNYTACTAHF